MGLLTKLGLAPLPQMVAAGGPLVRSAGGPGDENPLAGLPLLDKLESRNKELAFDFMRFPVTVAGKTREMIVQQVESDREGIAFALGDVQRAIKASEAEETALAPLAVPVEQAMKTPAAKLSAEIHRNASEKMRTMGRSAVNARAVLGLTDAVQKMLDELLKNARRQLELAGKSLDAQNKIEQASELRRQAKEIAGAIDLLGDLFDKAKDFDVSDATLAGAGLSMVTWGLKALAGVDRLEEQAGKLEEAAKALQVQVVREAFVSAAAHAKALGAQVRPLLDDFKQNATNYNQQRGEVEKLYDSRSKGAFRFAAFDKALRAGEKVLALLEDAAVTATQAERRVALAADWLNGMLKVEGKCLSHHKSPERSPFEPDPRVVYEETTKMKDEMRAALKALDPLRKRAETMTLGIKMQTGDALRRQQRWLEYYGAAQTALFTAPEPEPR